MTFRLYTMIGLLALVALVGLTVACGDDDDDDDPRQGQIGSVSENAVYAWIEDGPAGLYDYLAADVTAACTVEDVETALEGRAQPTDWRNTSGFEFSGEDAASATVTIVTADGDVEEEWSFTREGDSWRIASLPGLEACTA
jgi:hypothetical protein